MTAHHEMQQTIDLLRRGARAAPTGTRRRVGARLSGSTGIAALAGVAGVVEATGIATAHAAAAPASAVPALGALSLLKTFAVGVGLGASFGLGLHAVSRAVTTTNAVESRPPEPPSATVTTAHPVAEVTATPETVSAAAAELSGREDATGANHRATAQRRPAAVVNPEPELPTAVTAETSSVESLRAQQALLDEARGALRRGDAPSALAGIEAHEQRFPRTAFEEERQALRVRALSRSGQNEQARTELERFATRFPNSLLLSTLRAAVEGPQPSP